MTCNGNPGTVTVKHDRVVLDHFWTPSLGMQNVMADLAINIDPMCRRSKGLSVLLVRRLPHWG